jgi:hypothetical protein
MLFKQKKFQLGYGQVQGVCINGPDPTAIGIGINISKLIGRCPMP